MNKRQIIPFVLLLIAFSLWLYFKPKPVIESLPDHHPSSIAHQITNTHYTDKGDVDFQVFAQKMTNFSDKEVAVLLKPKLISYIYDQETGEITTWQVTSDNGVLYAKEKLILSNNVLVENLSKDQAVQTMETQELTIMLAKKEISTDQAVLWKGPQMRQQGVGMWASFITDELIVNNDITAVYFNEKN